MVQIGKRYRCTACEAVVVCLQPVAEAVWRCCQQEMEIVPVDKLPSSD